MTVLKESGCATTGATHNTAVQGAALCGFFTSGKIQSMELIARIDCDGRTYIGKWRRDTKWVKEGNAKPVTIVRNQYGG